MSNLYRGPSIDASYQVSVHMVEGFWRRRLKCEKLTDDGKSSHCLCQGELKRTKSFFLIIFHTITDCTYTIISKLSILYHALSQIETTHCRVTRLILAPGQMYS